MIIQKTDTHLQRVQLLGGGPVTTDGQPLATDRTCYFRTLWLRRGQCVPPFMAKAGVV